ncbi:BamA/TamA family outer membrane protein, partial [candidate division WOR-3 bacterium]|nr:BamA/TamA family outer membrane protein [candidate division WOR-3 bacterium]
PLDYTRGGVTLRVERVFIDSVKNHPFPSTPILGFDPASYPKTTISTTFGLVRDSRDYFINPSSGSYFNQSIEFAGGPLGGDINFIKEIADVHINFPIAWERKIVLTQKMRVGYVTGYTRTDTVPLYERFRPGGTSYDGFVRGYDDLSLGTVSKGALLGGRAMTVFNTELKVKVIPQLALIAFFDAGNAWERIDQVNLSELKKGIGAGIRFEIPFMGVLGFDAGWGLDYPKGTTFSEAFRPHFQISRTF